MTFWSLLFGHVWDGTIQRRNTGECSKELTESISKMQKAFIIKIIPQEVKVAMSLDVKTSHERCDDPYSGEHCSIPRTAINRGLLTPTTDLQQVYNIMNTRLQGASRPLHQLKTRTLVWPDAPQSAHTSTDERCLDREIIILAIVMEDRQDSGITKFVCTKLITSFSRTVNKSSLIQK